MSAPFLSATSNAGLIRLAASEKGNSDLNWLKGLDPERGSNSNPPAPTGNPNRNRKIGIIIAVSVAVIVCVALFGLAIYRAFVPSTGGNETTSGGSNITCQELIDRALQASGDSCDQIGSNQVCYGNNTLTAELNSAGKFAQAGDVVSVADLRRLAASPLNLASEEWGIAVFKVFANLPRSLPGETITMIVFGNTTLDNPSNNLQTFYFSSTLGQILCDDVPFDGLMITMPDGAGVSFVINGAEMTLMGNASITATRNGSMEVSVFSGTASITVNGQYQIVTAGQSTSMALGGPDGTTAISPPSPPQPLSPEQLTLACTLTGSFCSQQEITPVSPLDAAATLITELGLDLSNNTTDGAPTSIPSPTPAPVLTSTPARTPTPEPSTPAPSPTPAPVLTSTPARTPTPEPPTATPKPEYVTLCHYIEQSGTYNILTVQIDLITGSTGHNNHPGDILLAPAGGCPQPSPTPKPTQKPHLPTKTPNPNKHSQSTHPKASITTQNTI